MFDEEKFREVLKLKAATLMDIAEVMGISKVTLYRKMNGDSDFYRGEIQKCCDYLKITNMDDIFFAAKVT